MKTGTKIAVVAVVALAMTLGGLRQWRTWEAEMGNSAPPVGQPAESATAKQFLKKAEPFPKSSRAPVVAASAVERAGQVAQIRKDYDEIRAKMSAEFAAAGGGAPGGLNTFLRQLALLEREMHADIAKVLPPRELEDYEMRETTTGKNMAQQLGALNVPEETQRAVFRLRREFDNRFALVFDVTPAALLERERVQQAMLAQVRGMMDEATFGALLGVDDPSFRGLQALAVQQGLPAKAAVDLWQVKQDYIMRKLEIQAQVGLTAEQRLAMQVALAAQTRSRVGAVMGPDAMLAGGEALGWLPHETNKQK